MIDADIVKAAALQAQKRFERQITTVCVPIHVPINEVDLRACYCDSEWDSDLGKFTYDVDLSGANFQGHEIELDYLPESAEEMLIQRKIEEFNEGPEAA